MTIVTDLDGEYSTNQDRIINIAAQGNSAGLRAALGLVQRVLQGD